VPEDHYGVLIPFYFAADGDMAFDIVARSIRPRADLPMSEFTAFGNPDQVRAKVQAYIAAGATKFVMRSCGPFEGWREQVALLAKEVIQPLQTPTD
jgi:alkanesulfonate monooxygenase SsuD/methylene tetrahydromethanopterin reductase-like flavin-dependent oxidoreductase (luciferase family)